jgi:hypothetical protein
MTLHALNLLGDLYETDLYRRYLFRQRLLRSTDHAADRAA